METLAQRGDLDPLVNAVIVRATGKADTDRGEAKAEGDIGVCAAGVEVAGNREVRMDRATGAHKGGACGDRAARAVPHFEDI